MIPSSQIEERTVSISDQIAPRMTIRFILCFPFPDHSNQAAAIERLKKAVSYVVTIYPFLAGTVVLASDEIAHKDHVRLREDPKMDLDGKIDKIFHVKEMRPDCFPSYSEMKASRFPAESLCTKDIAPAAAQKSVQDGAPAMLVQADFVEGGLLLSVYLHHSICDGFCMRKVLETLAKGTALTDREITNATRLDVSLMKTQVEMSEHLSSVDRSKRFDELPEELTERPRVALAQSPRSNRRPVIRLGLGHVQTKIFAFQDETLADLANACNKGRDKETMVTKNDVIGALIWASTVVARIPEDTQLLDDKISKILIPVDYRKRIDPPVSSSYFGNAVSCPIASVEIQKLVDIIQELQARTGVTSLAHTAQLIKTAINSVDTKFVAEMLESGKLTPDSWFQDVKSPNEDSFNVNFNTWAALGAETKWNIPGITDLDAPPEFVRKGHELQVHGANLILPRRRDSKDWEVVIQLQESAMKRLKENPVFKQCVSAIIG